MTRPCVRLPRHFTLRSARAVIRVSGLTRVGISQGEGQQGPWHQLTQECAAQIRRPAVRAPVNHRPPPQWPGHFQPPARSAEDWSSSLGMCVCLCVCVHVCIHISIDAMNTVTVSLARARSLSLSLARARALSLSLSLFWSTGRMSLVRSDADS
jgi:hypothetical protein